MKISRINVTDLPQQAQPYQQLIPNEFPIPVCKGFSRRIESFNAVKIPEKAFGAKRKEIAEVLSIPIAILNRRKSGGKLTPFESDRIIGFAVLRDEVLAKMQSNENTPIA